ncbi:MAG: hypothetical protein LBD73_01395 [Deferribacteraceae bacterium]|jgi:hypothetical protein|nr:hypothetical protein [Deferribacteraceae bacterium]
MRHGKKYSGGYDYNAIREYETKIEKQNELKRSLEPSKLWVLITVIVFISLLIITLAAVKIHSVWYESKLRSDVLIYLNLRKATESYLIMNGFEPDRGAIDPFPVSGNIIQTLVSSGRLNYEDFYSPLLKRSLIFRECEDINMGHLCTAFAQETGEVTALDVHDWPPKGMNYISAVPVRYACTMEVIYDDRNYYQGTGVSKGSRDKIIPKLCIEESMKPDLIGEFDYIVVAGTL